jgi:hypothetical protein
VLLSGAALVVRSFAHVAAVDPGIRPRGVLVASLELPRETYQAPGPTTAAGNPTFRWLPSRGRLAEELVSRLEGDPRVATAGVSVQVPLSGGYIQTDVNVRPEGAEERVPGPKVWNVVTPGWFDAVGIPLLSGPGRTPWGNGSCSSTRPTRWWA